MSIAKLLEAIISNPDDLTTLPQIIEQVRTLENEVDGYQQRIVEMRELNKKYLAMVPIETEDPTVPEDEAPATLQDAKAYLVDTLGGN